MVICGLKLTHDGSVALIEDGKLIFSIEMEKLDNNPRYTQIEDTRDIEKILGLFGYSVSDVDCFAIDGWGGENQDKLAIQPRLEICNGYNKLSALNKGIQYQLNVGMYEEKNLKDDVLHEFSFSGLRIGDREYDYVSYLHVANHIMSTYCTSEYCAKKESSYVLVWDGGMYPRLYYFDVPNNTIENLGPIFLLIGNMYTIFSQHFGPFKVTGGFAKDNLSVAGKVMAYIALGNVRRELFKHFDEIYNNNYDYPMGFANKFAVEFKNRIEGMDYADEDILHSFHVYLEELLIDKLNKKVKRHGKKSSNICLAGGCALNIKWNSAIRNSGVFDSVYVSPFPNDSGSAIGAACTAMYKKTGNLAIEWSVYSGPEVIENDPAEGWKSRKCSIKELAELVYNSDEPIIILNGRAELGPRALGNRSIIANTTSERMKSLLNLIKKREDYRPVSPICLESKAKEYFTPGIKDTFMLFDHKVKEEYLNVIPAIIHLDGTARLQTISEKENPVFSQILYEYEKLSRKPMLCNTSANYKGSGFFPDIHSATSWNKVNYVWCNNVLYEKEEKIQYDEE